jgi:L-alanine-DL-glutamate epimerase-like enolase superfamily enzyme
MNEDTLKSRYEGLKQRYRTRRGQVRIQRAEWLLYDRRRSPDPGRASRWVVLRLSAGEGVEGVCHLPPWHVGNFKEEHRLKAGEHLVGCDPFDWEGTWARLREAGVPVGLLSFADVAVWDMIGKMEGCPVHALLGTQRTHVLAYKSTQFNIGPPDVYAADAVACRDRGYGGYKIHPYRKGDGVNDECPDIALFRAVREAVGPDYAVMADNFMSYDYDQAVRVGRVVDELNYTWYESPMPETDEWIDAYVRLRREVRTPVIGGETSPGAHETRRRWIEAGATAYGRLDVFFGGITLCLLTAIDCEQTGIPMDLHCAMVPHFQVFGATKASLIPYVEDYGVPMWAPMTDQGLVPVPQDPGVGDPVDWELVQRQPLDWASLAQRS